ncbi:hypothetical protein N8975_02205 [Candidatus Pelagibacter ubique]|nr:hypothetical protein [Candidatus Pelagibacter ubique]
MILISLKNQKKIDYLFKKVMIVRYFKSLCVKIFGYKNINIFRTYFLRIIKNIPKFYFYDESLRGAPNKIILGRKNFEIFYGYYDISPFDQSNKRVLYHLYDKNSKSKKHIHLGCTQINQDRDIKIKVFGKTDAWCWQMGSRLQWFPSSCGNLVIYNTVMKNGYGSILMDVSTEKIINQFSQPIYSLNNSAKSALYLNFDRLNRLRPGYGYKSFKDETSNNLNPNNDGLFKLDLISNKADLLHSIKEISETDVLIDYGNAEHYINHILWSPNGDKYLFFHLWQNHKLRNSRLMLAGEVNSLRCIYEPENGNVSHYTWRNNDEVLLTVLDKNKILKYILINLKNNTKKIIGDKILTVDGHPSFSPFDKNILLSDTYPDKYRNQYLYLYDIDKDQQKKIAYFYSPSNFKGETRCDLHPRFSHDGKKICIDTAHTGNRNLMIFPINEEKN